MRKSIVVREGWGYAIALAILTGVIYLLSPWASLLPFLLLLFVLFFFRNPKRIIPSNEGIIVSPADGKILDICEVDEPKFFKQRVKKVSIFLSVFNVHVNRSPIQGKITYTEYKEGKFIPAFKSHASEINERNYVGIENDKLRVMVVQITGFIARRIVSWVKLGHELARGERFGMIKFGSCTEIYVPLDVKIMVAKGDCVRGGETVIGRLE